MRHNYGKEFERQVKQDLEKVIGADVYRIPDQQSGYFGSKNLADFMVYRYPNHYYFECKTVHGNTLNFQRITPNQWQGLLHKSKIVGNVCGILCWYIEKDVTLFLPIEFLEELKKIGQKSVRYDTLLNPVYFQEIKWKPVKVEGRKKRTFFEYNFREFFNSMGDYNEI